jgi:hypothetical protein
MWQGDDQPSRHEGQAGLGGSNLTTNTSFMEAEMGSPGVKLQRSAPHRGAPLTDIRDGATESSILLAPPAHARTHARIVRAHVPQRAGATLLRLRCDGNRRCEFTNL